MKPNISNRFHSSITVVATVAFALALASHSARAATSTWTGISGNWSDTTTPGGVWAGGIPADGAGFTANFTGVDIAAAQTITLDSARTIGNISFIDATTASNNLTISGANILTLDVTTGAPQITVSNQKLTISSEIQGTEGLTKIGAGELELGGVNTSFSGPVSVTGGTLSLTNTSALGTASGITLANATLLRLDGSPAGTFTYNYPVAVTSGTATIKNYQGIANTFNLNGSLTGLGGLAFLNDSAGNVNLTFVLQQANTYRGNTSITAIAGGNSTIKLGVANALPTTTTLTINQGGGSNGSGRSSALDLAGFNQTIAGLISADINQFEGSVVRNTGGAATLTINNSSGSPRTFVGKIQQTGTLNLVKTGSNTQVLAANNSYTGTTTVNAGPLTLDFSQYGSSRTDIPSNYINSGSALELGGGTFTVIGRPNGSAVTSAAWTGVSGSPVLTFTTFPTGIVVGQAITGGTNITGATAYVVGIDAANSKVSLNTNVTTGATTGTFTTAATTVTTSQTFASTALNAGRSGLTIDANNGNGTLLALNAITRNVGGTVNFTQPAGTISATNGFTTTTANTAGTILGGWATMGGINWATNDGTNIVALGSYTTTTAAGTTAVSYAGADIDVDNSAGLLGGVITPNSLRFNAAAANTVTLAPGNNTITSGGILVSSNVGNNASTITGGTLRGASGSDLVVAQYNTSNNLIIQSVIDDNTTATSLTKTGTGSLALTGANIYTGSTYMNEGSLIVSAANNLGAVSSNLVFNGGTLHISGNTLTSLSSLGRTISVIPGKTVGLTIADPTNTFTVDQLLNQSTGGFTKGGTGTVIFNQANTYTGPTAINSGTLTLSGPGTLGNGASVILGGGQLDLGGTSQTVGAVSITAAYASGDTILNGSLTGTSYAATNTTGNAIVSANLLANGAIGFAKSGAGTTTLSGTNTYTGTTAVSGGVLKIGSTGALGGGNLTLSGGGVLGLTANFSRAEGTAAGEFQWTGSGGFAAYGANRNVSPGTLSWGSTSLVGNAIVLGAADADATVIWTSNISLAGGNRTIQVNNGSASVDAIISGTLVTSGGTFNKTGAGTLALTSSSNAFTGAVVINGGTLQFGNAGTTGNIGAISSIAITSGTLAVNRSNAFTQATELNGKIISGAGSFLQAGSGTTTLSLVNTYTGGTTVSAGTLLVNSPGSLSSTGAVAVNGGTLGGTGTIGASVTVAAAGNLAPGASAGTLTIGGGLDLSAQAAGAGTLTYELDTLAGTNDKIAVTGTLTIGVGALGFNNFVFTNLGGLEVGTYKLITSGGINPGDTLDPANLSGAIGALTGTLQITGGDLELVVSAGGPGPVDHFDISSIASPQTVGTQITGITLTAKDASNAVATGFTGTVTFGGTAGCTGTSASFVLGVLNSVSVTPTIAGSSLTFTVTDGALPTAHTGSTTITTVRTQYEAWASGALFDVDTNGDGVKNGLAWILGATNPNTSALDKLPTASTSGGNMILSFKRTQASINANTALLIEVGTTLATWPTVYTVGADTLGSTAGVTVTKDAPVAGTDTVTLTVTQSPDAKKFARLKAVQTP